MKDAWVWMMDYCHRNRLPPAQKWAWDKAKKAYQEAAQNTKESTAHLTTNAVCHVVLGVVANGGGSKSVKADGITITPAYPGRTT